MLEYAWTYLIRFVSVALINCLNPQNLSSCAQVWVWVPPYIQDVNRYLSDPPYAAERRAVEQARQFREGQAQP